MPDNDRVGVDVREEERDLLLGRPLGEDVEVVARRRVAVERAADAHGRRVRPEETELLLRERITSRIEQSRRRKSGLVGIQLAIGVAAEPEDAIAEAAQPLERAGRIGSARDDVPADDDGRVGRNFGEHRLERGEVAVNVVERRDRSHGG